jgi:hypothetical protein
MAADGARFGDRLVEATYVDDPMIEWSTIDGSVEASIPDRLVGRLLHLGRAYELHLLPLLPGVDALALNATQVENLIEELDWVAAHVDDPALRSACDDLRPVLQAGRRSGLRIE